MDTGRLMLAFMCALADCLDEKAYSVYDFWAIHGEFIYYACVENPDYGISYLNDYNAVVENGMMGECRELYDGNPARTRIEFDF